MAIHWSASWCYFVLFVTGFFMADWPREFPLRPLTYDFHKSMGVLVTGLLLWRVAILLKVCWKKYTRRTPKLTPEWWRKAALHGSLYLFMLAVPLSGFFFSNSYKSNNVHFLGVTMPDLFPQNSDLVDLGRNLHFWSAYVFLAFIILHVFQQQKVAKSIWRKWMKAFNR